jgi:glyoxylase-like metal-dependent hydrolase (beta-lactamase superfamily II)
MRVIQIAVGDMAANAFIVFKEGSNRAFVIDPGAEFDKITRRLEQNGIDEVTHILLTHGHFDHIGALAQLKQHTGATVCIHAADAPMLTSDRVSLGSFAGRRVAPCKPDVLFQGGETIVAADIPVEVLHTPGHSPGSVCYLSGDVMFSGDTLFYMYCGRTDLPGSDTMQYHHSLGTVLRGLKKDYVVYAGHGIKTRLSQEFENNAYLKSLL